MRPWFDAAKAKEMLRTAQFASCTGGQFFRGEKNGERVRSDEVKIAPVYGISKGSGVVS